MISIALESDAPELVALINSAYRGDSSRAGWTTEADYLDGQRIDAEGVLTEIRDPAHRILCHREVRNGPIVGCVLLRKFEDEKGIACYLGLLTVLPTLQARGTGRLLVEHAERFAAENFSARRMSLGVIQLRETLMAWYERRGYVRTGATKPFPYHDPRAGAPLRQDLHFVIFEKTLD